MSMLPIELIAEILSWLPVKSLQRFRCVNKTWHSVISHPKFAKLQVSRPTDCHRILVTTWPPQSVDYELLLLTRLSYPAMVAGDDPEEDPYPIIVGSCDGLVCFFKDLQMFIWNPTTGNCSRIPNPNSSFRGVLLSGICYNHSTADYGVIFSSRYSSDRTQDTVIELYTLKTRTWKRIEGYDLDPESTTSIPGFSWNGDLYWLSIEGSVYIVVCFDMVEESFKKMLRLPYTDSDIWNADLGMCANCLCVYTDLNGSIFECLVLKMEGNEVSYNRVFRYPHERFRSSDIKAICLTKNREVVMDHGGSELYWYDPKQDRCNGFWKHYSCESVLYQESLVSPDT